MGKYRRVNTPAFFKFIRFLSGFIGNPHAINTPSMAPKRKKGAIITDLLLAKGNRA